MALTKIKTAAITDDAVTDDKIANGTITSQAIANNAVEASAIKDENVTLAKLPHGDGSSNGKFLRSNNGADPTWEAALTSVADESITLAKLEHGDGSSDGKFLRSNNGADPTWETVAQTDTTYSISCVDGDNTDEEKIRLTAGGSGSGTDDVVLEAGTGLTIARSSDKITFTNTNPTAVDLTTVASNVLPDGDNTRDLGSSSKRWANVYVGDMQLSNEGATNDVDGTWGSYTLQEGADDLFLINNRTGKKYKFKITEVQ